MNSNPPSVVVRVKDAEKHFGEGSGRIHALRNVNLTAYAGEILMLVGPSGCGKTTLLSAIAGTLKIESGEIDVFGHRLHQLSGRALTRFRASHVGFIFQQFNLVPTLSVAENVSIPLRIQGASQREAIRRAKAALDSVGMADRWKEKPNKLSGGQQQRIAIARALVHEPPLVICDEPTAALDSKNGEIVLELFQSVARSADRAVIIVTHDNRIFSYADRLAQMDDGQIISEKPREGGSSPSGHEAPAIHAQL